MKRENKRLETKILNFEIQTQLSNEGLQNGVSDWLLGFVKMLKWFSNLVEIFLGKKKQNGDVSDPMFTKPNKSVKISSLPRWKRLLNFEYNGQAKFKNKT